MANAKVGDLTQRTSLQSGDRFYVVADPAGARSGQQILVDDVVAGADQTPQELANGITPTNTKYAPGDVRRYGALIDGTTDDTQAFQDAVDSGHYPAKCDVEGVVKFSGTVALDGDKSLLLNSNLDIERLGTSTAPLFHLYGNRNILDGGGGTIRNVLNANTHGLVLIGPALAETEGGTTDVPCPENVVRNLKLVGPENGGNPQDDGAPGIFIHSIRRKLYAVTNPTYDTTLEKVDIFNCDVGIEFSTDANRSVIRDVKILQYKTAAVLMNASYGNQFYGLKVESPLAWTGGSPRYCIHLKSQNSGTETDTNGSYPITEAYRNFFNMYGELGSGDGRLMDWDAPTTAGGENDFRGAISSSDGFGKNGLSDYAGLGTNTVDTWFTSNQGQLVKYHGWEYRRLDDDTGSILINGSRANIYTSTRSMTEDVTYDLFSVDNVGPTTNSVTCKLSYSGKQGGTDSSAIGGEIKWQFTVRTGTAQPAHEIYHHPAGEGASGVWDQPFFFIVTEEAGTAANTGKFTVSVATVSTPVDYNGFVECDIELISANAESAGNLDWAADVSILSSSTAGAVTNPVKSQLTKIKETDQTISTDTSLGNDDDLVGWVLDPDTIYNLEGQIIYNSGATPDYLASFDLSQLPQEKLVDFETGSTNNRQTSATGVVFNGSGSNIVLKVSGFIRTHATLETTMNYQWAQNVSDAGNTTTVKGSWIRVTKLRALLHEN